MKETMNLIAVTRILRKRQTPWEAKLWSRLRGNRFYGLKFKRQVPIGKYVADFCCQGKRLIVELDGGGHNATEVRDRDVEKERFLSDHGYRILRFWNNEIDTNLERVLETIRKAVG